MGRISDFARCGLRLSGLRLSGLPRGGARHRGWFRTGLAAVGLAAVSVIGGASAPCRAAGPVPEPVSRPRTPLPGGAADLLADTRALGLEGPNHWGTGKPRLAVVPFLADGRLPSTVTDPGPSLADQMLAGVAADRYEVYDRSRVTDLLAHERRAASDLLATDSAPAAFGRRVGVQFLVVGTLTYDGRTYVLTARTYNCRTGEVLDRASAQFATLDDAPAAVRQLAATLKLRADAPPAPADNAPRPNLIGAVNNAFKVTVDIKPQKAIYDEGDYLTLEVGVGRGSYVTIITQDPKGNETYLLPNPWQDKQQWVRAGDRVQFPPNDGATFRFPVLPPHGDTVVKVIATTRKLNLAGVDPEKLRAMLIGKAPKELIQAPPAGAKAIGVEGVPAVAAADPVPAAGALKPDRPIAAEPAAPIQNLLKPDEWATAEATIVTRPKASRP